MGATRTQIYLTAEQRRGLDARRKRDGRSLAAVVREAIDEYLKNDEGRRREVLTRTFGIDPDFTVPPRKKIGATDGDVFVAEVRGADEIVLRRKQLIDASQAYFWTAEWQEGEREAQEDIRRDRVKRFRSAKALIADLKR